MKLQHTRAIVDAIHSGALVKQELVNTPVFDLKVRVKEATTAGNARASPVSVFKTWWINVSLE